MSTGCLSRLSEVMIRPYRAPIDRWNAPGSRLRSRPLPIADTQPLGGWKGSGPNSLHPVPAICTYKNQACRGWNEQGYILNQPQFSCTGFIGNRGRCNELSDLGG